MTQTVPPTPSGRGQASLAAGPRLLGRGRSSAPRPGGGGLSRHPSRLSAHPMARTGDQRHAVGGGTPGRRPDGGRADRTQDESDPVGRQAERDKARAHPGLRVALAGPLASGARPARRLAGPVRGFNTVLPFARAVRRQDTFRGAQTAPATPRASATPRCGHSRPRPTHSRGTIPGHLTSPCTDFQGCRPGMRGRRYRCRPRTRWRSSRRCCGV